MYNDYWLEQINGRITITNSKLDDIIENQQTIITNQQTLISGDKELISGDKEINNNLTHINLSIFLMESTLVLTLLYTFITRSMKA